MKDGKNKCKIIYLSKTKIMIESYYLQSEVPLKEGEEIGDVFLSDDFDSFVESLNSFINSLNINSPDGSNSFSEYSLKVYKLLNGNGA